MIGDLPQVRISHSLRPFLNFRIDYCGPLYINAKRFQNRKKINVFVVIFVCMGSKAVHLELIRDMSTEAFIAGLERFFPRRGKSQSMYSDNGKNFVDATREINELYKLTLSQGFAAIFVRRKNYMALYTSWRTTFRWFM